MSEKLLPCPFCGGKAEIGPDEHYPDYPIIRCTGCGVYHFGSHLVERWNRRVPPPTTKMIIDDLRRAVRSGIGFPHHQIRFTEEEAAKLFEEWPEDGPP